MDLEQRVEQIERNLTEIQGTVAFLLAIEAYGCLVRRDGLGAILELRERVVKQAEQDIAAATWDAAAEKVVAIYEELVARPPQPPGPADRLSLFRD